MINRKQEKKMKKHKIDIKIKALQHLAMETLGDGTIVPYLSHSTFIGDMNDSCLESNISLEEVLNRLIEQNTRGENESLSNDDKKKLLSSFLAIQSLVKEKMDKVTSLPEYEDKLPGQKKKKFKA